MSQEKRLQSLHALLACEQTIALKKDSAAPAVNVGAVAAQSEAFHVPHVPHAKCCDKCADVGFCRRVLVAIDDLEPANWALQMGIYVAKLCRGRLALVHVIHGDMALTPEFATPRPKLAQEAHRAGEELLSQGKSLAPAELRTQTFLKAGDPSQQIIATARQWGADLIVVGTHGRAEIAHMLIGSTAESVVRQADCPVLTVGHDPADRTARQPTDIAEVLNASTRQS